MLLMDELTVKPFQDFVEKVLAERARLETELDWTPPEPPPEFPRLGDNRLVWKPSSISCSPSLGPLLTIDQLHAELPLTLTEYISRSLTDDFPLLLAKIHAGGGKTHAGVKVAQQLAREGLRVFWSAPNHEAFAELSLLKENGVPIFDPSLWLHFQSITKESYCKHAKSQKEWMKRNYPAMQLCKQFCVLDRWIKQCPYRQQAASEKPIVFGMHQHLTTGIGIADFDVVIIDELPLNAFKTQRLIPTKWIHTGDDGPFGELMDTLLSLSLTCEPGEVLKGRELFNWIGPFLERAYANREILERAVPVIPLVRDHDEITKQPYWYIMDFLWLSLKEYSAWEKGWLNWAERLKITNKGLYLLDRNIPWENLPPKTIILDATAEPALYTQIFGEYREEENRSDLTKKKVWVPREIEVYQPQINRLGTLNQVVARMNGKYSLLNRAYREKKQIEQTTEEDEETPDLEETTTQSKYTSNAHKLLLQCQAIRSRYTGRVCVVCHKDLHDLFDPVFGPENVLHFGNIRGKNLFQDCECLIVAGTPSPNPFDVIDIAVALDKERIDPFAYGDSERSLFTEREKAYLITAKLTENHPGELPFRRLRGYWDHWQLQAIQEQLSKAELEQAIHRARPNSRKVEVWIMSGLQTDEPLDGIWDELPSEMLGFTAVEWALVSPFLESCWQNGICVGARELGASLGLLEASVRKRRMLLAIYDNQSEPKKWLWADDPSYTGKGGPKVQWLKPVDLGFYEYLCGKK